MNCRRVERPTRGRDFNQPLTPSPQSLASSRVLLREEDGVVSAALLLHVAPPEVALRAVDEHREHGESARGDEGQRARHPPRAVEDDERVDDDERDAELRGAELRVADVELAGRRERLRVGESGEAPAGPVGDPTPRIALNPRTRKT